MDSGGAGVDDEDDGDEAKRMHLHGAGPVCWGPSGVDVPGKYTFGSRTDCMLNEVRWQVVECACVMGPCRRTLS